METHIETLLGARSYSTLKMDLPEFYTVQVKGHPWRSLIHEFKIMKKDGNLVEP